MNKSTFNFLAQAIGIRASEYPEFFGLSADELNSSGVVVEAAEKKLLEWQASHASHVEYALLCFRVWHKREVLEEIMADYAAVTDLKDLHELSGRARERCSAHIMDDLTRLSTKIQIVIPDERYFKALSDQGLVSSPSFGMHIAAFHHAVLLAHREGLRVEILDPAGNP